MIPAALLLVLLRAAPAEPGALSAEAERTFRAGDHAAAAVLYARLATLRPGDAGVHFNHAAALAKAGEIEEALDALGRAVEAGFPHAKYLDAAPELESLRAHPRYPELLARARQHEGALRAKRRAAEDAVRAAEAALDAGAFSRARAALEAVEAADAPEPARVFFLQARAASGTGALDEAAGALGRALEAGWVDVAALDAAPSLRALKKRADGRALWKRVSASEAALVAQTRASLVRRGRGGFLLALHGYGQEPAGFADQLAAALPDAGVVAVRGPAAVDAGGYGWVDLQRTRVAVLAALGQKGVARRPVLLGFSQGGWLGLRLALAEPERFGGAVICGTSRFEPPGDAALARAAKAGLRIALIAGEGDPAAVEAARRAEGVLREAGIPVTVQVVPELGHALPPADALREAYRFASVPTQGVPRSNLHERLSADPEKATPK